LAGTLHALHAFFSKLGLAACSAEVLLQRTLTALIADAAAKLFSSPINLFLADMFSKRYI
jgi:hypothetical protein